MEFCLNVAISEEISIEPLRKPEKTGTRLKGMDDISDKLKMGGYAKTQILLG